MPEPVYSCRPRHIFAIHDGCVTVPESVKAAPLDAKLFNTLDLYKVFETMCRDEEDFRAQLATYVKGSGVTPRDIPALVFNSHPQLRPTSRNKMFNAEVTWAAFTYREPTGQAATGKGLKYNIKLFENVLLTHGIQSSKVSVNDDDHKNKFDIYWCEVPHKEMLDTLNRVVWVKDGNSIAAEIAFLEKKDCPVDSWLVVAPQVGRDTGGGSWEVGAHNFRCILRSRFDTRFGVFSSSVHVTFAKWIVGQENSGIYSSTLKPRKHTGVLLLYPTKELIDPKRAKSGLPTMGFSLTLPVQSSNLQRVAFKVKRSSDSNAIIIEKSQVRKR